MSGIKDLLGFVFWLDNSKRIPLETLLENKRHIPKHRAEILKALQTDGSQNGHVSANYNNSTNQH